MKILPPVLPLSLVEHPQILKRCDLSVMIRTLIAITHITRTLLIRAKWIVQESLLLNEVSIMKVTRAINLMKFCIGLIFFVIDNRLMILLLSITYHNFCHIKYTINLTGKSDTNHNKKECKTKCLIDEVLEKFDGTLNIYIIR